MADIVLMYTISQKSSIYLEDFPDFYTWEKNFVTPCLISFKPFPFLKWFYSNQEKKYSYGEQIISV